MRVELEGSTWRGTKEKLNGEEESSKGQNIANSNSKPKFEKYFKPIFHKRARLVVTLIFENLSWRLVFET
jgi:hypothetical protein